MEAREAASAKEARVAETVGGVLANLPRLAADMLDSVDRALQTALLTVELGQSLHHQPTLPASLALPPATTFLPAAFEDLPENFLEPGPEARPLSVPGPVEPIPLAGRRPGSPPGFPLPFLPSHPSSIRR